MKVTFLDVGQANSALVEFPMGKKMLIDGGGFPRDHFDVGRMVVAPYLWHSKIRRIDYLVLSHPQADHMNGLRFIVDSVLLSKPSLPKNSPPGKLPRTRKFQPPSI